MEKIKLFLSMAKHVQSLVHWYNEAEKKANSNYNTDKIVVLELKKFESKTGQLETLILDKELDF